MKKVTIEYQIESQEDVVEAKKALDIAGVYCALHEIGQLVFRPARKHGYQDQLIQDLVEKLDKLAEDSGGERGGTELISLLEEKFYAILREHEVQID